MIRSIGLCTFFLVASPALAQLSPVLAPQLPRPRRDAKVESAAARQSNADKLSAERALLEEKVKQRDQLQTEIDQLRISIGMSQQVLVRIQVLEVNRTKLRTLGVDWAVAGPITELNKFIARMSPKASGAPPGNIEFQVVELKQPDAFKGIINALQEMRIAKMLAEPNLVVTRGRPASFHVGGEIPMPSAPDSKKAVNFQEFGTRVDILARDVDEKKVRLELRLSVREPDFSRQVEIAGTQVPSMRARQIDTAMEIPSQHTALLAGLYQEREIAIKTDGGIESQPEEVELLILVTPELIQPPLAASASE